MGFDFVKTSFSKKGFIGPIGDDLPSLVPIVVALLLFFSIFAMTLNTYATKNNEIQKQITMTSVARELKGDSLVLGLDQFKQKCYGIQVKKYPYSFMSAIYPTDIYLTEVIKDFANASGDVIYADSSSNMLKQTINGHSLAYFCNYNAVGRKEFSTTRKNYLIRFYPIAVQYPISIAGTEQYLIVPALMAMVFWG